MASLSPSLTAPSQDLQGLLDAVVDAIVIIDHLGLIHQFSRSAERLFGYPREEVLGQNVAMLMPEPARTAHDDYLARYMATREPHVIGRGREVDARRKDGSLFPVQLAVGAVPDCEPPRFVGIIHDITLQRQAEENAIRLQDRLTHIGRFATIGEMTSGIAHELNQPLAAIATYADACDRLLGLPDADIPEVREALREIAGQAVRAGDIIRRLRGLARRDEPRPAAADINSIIAELSDLIEPDAKAHGIAYRLELTPNLPKLSLDSGQIQQVLLNLVRNALESIDFAQVNTGEVVVRTSLSDEGDVEIAVSDNGPGVSEAIAQRIFDPFCSTKPAGTGLGLAISRTIVRAHEGTLVHRPNDPVGACFIVKLTPSREEAT
jgi:two-component system, LuxR family, sensor kinase FixL